MIKQKIRDWYQKIPYALKIAILTAIISKLVVFSIGYAGAYSTAIANGDLTNPSQLLMNQFAKWDGSHYLYLAQNGYTNQGDAANFIVFFPLYPFLIRLITFDLAYVNLSGLIISNISSLIAVIYLFKLAKLDYSNNLAVRAVLFFSVFPTAYFLSAVFTESLFLATVIASLYYARKGKWAFAGSLGLLAALTRIAGLLLLPTLIVEYFNQKKWRIKATDPKITWTCLPAIGFLTYLLLNYQVTGNPFAFIEIQRTHWFETLNPIDGLLGAAGWSINGTYPDSLTIGYAQIIFAALGLTMVIAGFIAAYKHKLRLSYALYILLIWMLAVSTSFWISIPRYMLSMFPMFMLLALLSRKKILTITLIVLSFAALAFFTYLFAAGEWAF